MSYDGKKILAVVPARGGSKEIVKKNLIKIKDVSLIGHAAKTIDRLPWIDRAVISSDDNGMLQEGILHGLSDIGKRPDELSGDSSNAIDVWRHALLESEKIWETRFDCTVLLEPTSPLRKPTDVEAVVNKLIVGGYDSVVTVTETDSKSHPLKQLVTIDDKVTHYESKGADIVMRQQLDPVYHRNGVAYAMMRDSLLSDDRILGDNASAIIVKGWVINIDTIWDVRYAEWLCSEGYV